MNFIHIVLNQRKQMKDLDFIVCDLKLVILKIPSHGVHRLQSSLSLATRSFNKETCSLKGPITSLTSLAHSSTNRSC